MEKRNNTLNGLSLSQLIDFRQQYDVNSQSAIYEHTCIVGHNMSRNETQNFPFLEQPTRMNLIMICLCLEGDCVIQCDMQQCKIKDNSLFICKPGTIIQPLGGNVMSFSTLIVDTQYHANQNFSIQKLLPHYDALEKLTVIELKPDESIRMNTMIGYLYDSIRSDSEQLFYHEGVKSLLSALSYEVLRHFSRHIKNNTFLTGPQFSRQHAYFREFTNLLGIHFREERRVEYYADKLHITPKYLGTLVMQHTGRSASHWISLYVMSEARALLLNTAMSIQEIAYSLNFPNQSFFGKYFKSHQGVTPGEFRQQKLKNNGL